MLVRLLYASRAVGPVTPQIVESILQQSFGQNPLLASRASCATALTSMCRRSKAAVKRSTRCT